MRDVEVRVVRSTYDLSVDALYLRVSDAPVARTVDLDPGTLADLGESGALVGVEVLRPGRTWPLAELLRRYDLTDEDEAVLRAMFPHLLHERFQRLTEEPGGLGAPASYQDRHQQFTGDGICVPA
jgi:uncharacterized protein YuzE